MKKLTKDQIHDLLRKKETQYQLIDRYIEQNHTATGETFTCADVQAWLDGERSDVIASVALQAHRQAGRLVDDNGKHRRVFTTKRSGYGRAAYYTIVEDKQGVFPKAVREMHQQIGAEAVNRWINEMEMRMQPLIARNHRAAALFKQAATEMTLVASVFDIKLDELLDGEERPA